MSFVMNYDEWIEYMEEKVAKIPRIQAAISNFQVLPRLGKLISEKAEVCPECKIYWKKLQEATMHLDKFFDDGNRYSQDFEDLVSEIMQHLKSVHNIRPKGYLLSVYTVIGMTTGVLLISLFTYLIVPELIKAGVVLGWLLGLLIGWFVGKVKEEKKRKSGQIF